MEQNQTRQYENIQPIDLSGSAAADIVNSYLRILSSHYPSDPVSVGNSQTPRQPNISRNRPRLNQSTVPLFSSSIPLERTGQTSFFRNTNYNNGSFPGTTNYLEDTDVNGHVLRQHHLLQDTISKYNTITHNFEEFLTNNLNVLQPMQTNFLVENMNHYHENIAKVFDVLKMTQESINTIVYVSKMTRFLETIQQINNSSSATGSSATESSTTGTPTTASSTTASSTTGSPTTASSTTGSPTTADINRTPFVDPIEITNTNRSRLYQRVFYSNNGDDENNSHSFSRRQHTNENNIRINENRNKLSIQEIGEKIEYISYNNSSNTQEDRCPISLEDFVENEIVCKIKGCHHCFKITPLMNWLSINTYCPVCRYNLKTNSNENTNSNQQDVSEQDENSDIIDGSVMDILERSIETFINTISNDLSGNEISLTTYMGII